MGAEMLHADRNAYRRTDRKTDTTKLIVAFRNFANAPKMSQRTSFVISCKSIPVWFSTDRKWKRYWIFFRLHSGSLVDFLSINSSNGFEIREKKKLMILKINGQRKRYISTDRCLQVLDCWTLENGTDMSRNVGKQLTTCAVQHPGKAKIFGNVHIHLIQFHPKFQAKQIC